MSVSVTEFQKHLDNYLDAAESEPVIIEKSRGEKFALISYDMYKRLVALEDAVWVERAKQAQARGYASQEEVEQLLKRASQI
jgi:prevent-host-death family protein